MGRAISSSPGRGSEWRVCCDEFRNSLRSDDAGHARLYICSLYALVVVGNISFCRDVEENDIDLEGGLLLSTDLWEMDVGRF